MSVNRRFNSKRPRFERKRNQIKVWLLIFCGILGANQLAADTARAGNFLETVGTSVLFGTVLGASTLPFYDQPSSHMRNMVYGAAAGLTVGLGLWVYGLLQKSDVEEHYFPEARRGIHLTTDTRIQNQDIHFAGSFRYPEVQFTDPAFQQESIPVWLPVVSLKL